MDPINLGDFLSALALPLLVSVNFAHHLPESTMETAIHHILCLGCFEEVLDSEGFGWLVFLNGKKTRWFFRWEMHGSSWSMLGCWGEDLGGLRS